MTHTLDKVGIVLFGRNDLLREGLRRIIESNGFDVSATEQHLTLFLAGNPGPLRRPAKLFIIDAADSVDVDEESIEAVHHHAPDARIVILHDAFDMDYMIDAFQAGIDGYIVKSITYESLIECLRLVIMGEKVMPSALASHLPEWGRRLHQAQPACPVSQLLSARELQTLRCLSRGDPNKVIARELDISEATVKVHVKAILRKLGLHNRTQAAAWTLHAGIDLDEPPQAAPVAAMIHAPESPTAFAA
ncbi:LuxR C-terminal-related transcriptional regulator [Novosphingobium bradum]|uniref:LuxR C-terminal-related transcriptional regulator n=1 Tax=Novosphingobium bradum TaxID=1737444 RepID=A0ABV7IV69_9SPHN